MDNYILFYTKINFTITPIILGCIVITRLNILSDNHLHSSVYEMIPPVARDRPNDFSEYPHRVVLRDLTKLTPREISLLMYAVDDLQFKPPLKVKTPSGLTCGTMDIIHEGHIYFLLAAASLLRGGDLIVLLRSDEMYEKQKGKKPVLNERERARIITAIDGVKAAIIIPTDGEESYRFIEGLFVEGYPDYYFFGYDQLDPNQPSGWNRGLMEYFEHKGTEFYRLPKYGEVNSSIIKARIIKSR